MLLAIVVAIVAVAALVSGCAGTAKGNNPDTVLLEVWQGEGTNLHQVLIIGSGLNEGELIRFRFPGGKSNVAVRIYGYGFLQMWNTGDFTGRLDADAKNHLPLFVETLTDGKLDSKGRVVINEIKPPLVAFYSANDETRPVVDPATLIEGNFFVVAPKGVDIGSFDPDAYTFTITSGATLLEGGIAKGWPANRFRCAHTPGNATIQISRNSDGKIWVGSLTVNPRT
jgi:hypothetical protein